MKIHFYWKMRCWQHNKRAPQACDKKHPSVNITVLVFCSFVCLCVVGFFFVCLGFLLLVVVFFLFVCVCGFFCCGGSF